MARISSRTTQATTTHKYRLRPRKVVNYVEEDQPDNKNDPDYNPDEIRAYWIEKHRANKFVNTVKQAIAKIENMNSSRIEPVSVISSMITQSRNVVSTRSKNNAVESHPAVRYNLRSR
jgi:hypothetical protein